MTDAAGPLTREGVDQVRDQESEWLREFEKDGSVSTSGRTIVALCDFWLAHDAAPAATLGAECEHRGEDCEQGICCRCGEPYESRNDCDDPPYFCDPCAQGIVRRLLAHDAAPAAALGADAPMEGDCKACKGSGEGIGYTNHLGPDDYEIAINCPRCGGSGNESDAAQRSMPATPPSAVEDGVIGHGLTSGPSGAGGPAGTPCPTCGNGLLHHERPEMGMTLSAEDAELCNRLHLEAQDAHEVIGSHESVYSARHIHALGDTLLVAAARIEALARERDEAVQDEADMATICRGFQDRAEAAEARAAKLEALLKWLDTNTTHCLPGTIPVLGHVSKRIWYHATDNVTAYPFSVVALDALGDPTAPPSAPTQEQPPSR